MDISNDISLFKEGVSRKSRNQMLDTARGIAIALVVAGHIIQIQNPDNFDSHLIFRIIYAFHMPMFMMISGITAYISGLKTNTPPHVCKRNLFYEFIINIKKRIYRLVVPFLLWSFIHYFILNGYSVKGFYNYLFQVAAHPDLELWFLWVLFLNTFFLLSIQLVLNCFFNHSEYKNWIEIAIFILFSLILGKASQYISGLNLCSWHYKFFISGYLFRKYKQFLYKYSKQIVFLCGIIFLALVPGWYRISPPPFLTIIAGNKPYFSILTDWYNVMTAISGSIICMSISAKLPGILCKTAAYLGRHTIEIYILSNYLILNYVDNKYANYLICFILGITIPILCKLISGYLPLINNLLFGSKK